MLLSHYLGVAARELDVPAKTLSAESLSALEAFDWPGNVRQVVNLCRRLSVTAPGREIQLQDLPGELAATATGSEPAEWSRSLRTWAAQQLLAGRTRLLDSAQPEFERALIEAALSASRGHRQKAAKLLGWGRNTLTRKIRELGLDRQA